MSQARIPGTKVDGVLGAVVKRVAKKMVGRVPASLGVMWHHQPVGAHAEVWQRYTTPGVVIA